MAHIKGGHRMLYRDYITGPTRIFMWDPCPVDQPTRNIDGSSYESTVKGPQQLPSLYGPIFHKAGRGPFLEGIHELLLGPRRLI